MRGLLLVLLGLFTLGAVWKFEKKNDGTLIALSPFIAAIAIMALTRRERQELADY